jgi:hypothetical protein
MVIMLTGRLPHLSEQIEELLELHKINFDEYHYKSNGDTLTSKINTIKSLLHRYPNVTEIEMWEDREPHVLSFEQWGEDNNINLNVNLVTNNGQIIKGGVNDLINESLNNNQIFYEKISNIISPPYFSDLKSLGIPVSEWAPILNIIFGKDLIVDGETQTCTTLVNKNNGELVYSEWTNGDWADFDRGTDNLQIHQWGNINESVDNKLSEKVLNILKPPYINNLDSMGFNSKDAESILSKLFNQRVYIYDNSSYSALNNSVNDPTEWNLQSEDGEVLYVEYVDGYYQDWRN